MRTNIVRSLMVLLIFGIGLMGCGGDSGVKTKEGQDGRIFLENATDVEGGAEADILVDYFNEVLGKRVELEVPPGEKEDISQVTMPYGTKVMVTLTGRQRGVHSHQLSYDLEVTVDGNVTVYVKEYNVSNIGHPFEYTIL